MVKGGEAGVNFIFISTRRHFSRTLPTAALSGSDRLAISVNPGKQQKSHGAENQRGEENVLIFATVWEEASSSEGCSKREREG